LMRVLRSSTIVFSIEITILPTRLNPLFVMKYLFFITAILFVFACQSSKEDKHSLRLWYNQPAEAWPEALPIGNGRMGAMVFGSVEQERIQFNEETLWTGQPHDYANEEAHLYLDEIRSLLFQGKQKEAEDLAMEKFMSVPLRQKAYQPFGDVIIDFENHGSYTNYYRELDLENAICRTTYSIDQTKYTREVFASYPDDVVVIHLQSEGPSNMIFSVGMTSPHEQNSVQVKDGLLIMDVVVEDGGMKGQSQLMVTSDGNITVQNNRISVDQADGATIYLTASTNFIKYDELSENPLPRNFNALNNRNYEEIKQKHIADFQSLFNRFSLDLGTVQRDTLPTDTRIRQYSEYSDPQLVSIYVQYGRYLLISSSRPGTYPANLQGIWNHELAPSWDSKYTVNINTEMNYWPAELTNLSECHEPLFQLITECSETGKNTAKAHYQANGWVLHHNTDQWRGTAPINHSNHGIWVSGSGWLSSHLWERYLFTQDEDFLRNRAYPIMKEAAVFYKDFLIEDPNTGWLISTPSNSPEIGGLVAGPTMDHQIIRSLFKACVQASGILEMDTDFASQLEMLIPRIAPNQIGQYGQLQEWLEDKDDPENKHRHVSHLWGMHPGKDINWEESPEFMEAAKQSLTFRGDEGTGWSLAWKINFWARLLDGNHANELIRLLFRPVESQRTNHRGGGSYMNLFDAHPPFQIDGNFGAAAGIVELLVQSHLSTIDILPALPDAYPEGSIKGVCARGGFELDFEWTDKKLESLTVKSKAGKKCKLRYGDKTVEFETNSGERYRLNGSLEMVE
jgi:alpha-L-fucosidase 2